jgi:hypothetical protein
MEDMTKADRAVFRLPAVSLILPLVLTMFVTPLANVGGGWIWLYVLPVLVLGYVLLTRTVADGHGVRTSGIHGFHRMAWSEMDGLEFTASSWAIAVGHDGGRLRLPMVRPRDLPRLAAVSGGSLQFDQPPDGPAEPDSGDGTADGATLDLPQVSPTPSQGAPEGTRPGPPAE